MVTLTIAEMTLTTAKLIKASVKLTESFARKALGKGKGATALKFSAVAPALVYFLQFVPEISSAMPFERSESPFPPRANADERRYAPIFRRSPTAEKSVSSHSKPDFQKNS
jgi:hypothetical protein